MRTFLLFAISLVYFRSFSQVVNQAYGYVIDASDNRGLEGVSVQIRIPSGEKVETDSDGRFVINNPQKNKDYDFYLEKNGYEPVEDYKRRQIEYESKGSFTCGYFYMKRSNDTGILMFVSDGENGQLLEDINYEISTNPHNTSYISKSKFVQVPPKHIGKNITLTFWDKNSIYEPHTDSFFFNGYHVLKIRLPSKKINIVPRRSPINQIKSWDLNEIELMDSARAFIRDIIELEKNGEFVPEDILQFIESDNIWHALYLREQIEAELEDIGVLRNEYRSMNNALKEICLSVDKSKMGDEEYEKNKNYLDQQFSNTKEKLSNNYNRQVNSLEKCESCIKKLRSNEIINREKSSLRELTFIEESIEKHKKRIQQNSINHQNILSNNIQKCRDQK